MTPPLSFTEEAKDSISTAVISRSCSSDLFLRYLWPDTVFNPPNAPSEVIDEENMANNAIIVYLFIF